MSADAIGGHRTHGRVGRVAPPVVRATQRPLACAARRHRPLTPASRSAACRGLKALSVMAPDEGESVWLARRT